MNKKDTDLESILELLENLQKLGKIADLQIDTEAQLVPCEKLVSTFSFNIPTGLTIGKYHKLKEWFENNFDSISVRRLYHKHRFVIYYKYESDSD